MKRLISIGIIAAVLATIILTIPASARINEPPPPPKVKIFSELTFDWQGNGCWVSGGIIAYEGYTINGVFTRERHITLLALVYTSWYGFQGTAADIYAAVGMSVGVTPVTQLTATYNRFIVMETVNLDPPPEVWEKDWPEVSGFVTNGKAMIKVRTTQYGETFQKAYSIAFMDGRAPYIADVTPIPKPLAWLNAINSLASLISSLLSFLAWAGG